MVLNCDQENNKHKVNIKPSYIVNDGYIGRQNVSQWKTVLVKNHIGMLSKI